MGTSQVPRSQCIGEAEGEGHKFIQDWEELPPIVDMFDENKRSLFGNATSSRVVSTM